MAEKKLEGKKILFVVPPTQFRDEEFFEPKRILEEEGATLVIASTAIRTCRGMKGGITSSEIAIADAKSEDYDALVLCGGSSVPQYFWNDKKLLELSSQMASSGKVVAAICLSTVVLAKAKLLEGREATVYFLPQAIEELKSAGAKYVKQTLVVANNLIMAEGPPQAAEFANAVRAALSG